MCGRLAVVLNFGVLWLGVEGFRGGGGTSDHPYQHSAMSGTEASRFVQGGFGGVRISYTDS